MLLKVSLILLCLFTITHCNVYKCDLNIKSLLCMRIKNIQPSKCRLHVKYTITKTKACLVNSPLKCVLLPESCQSQETTTKSTTTTTTKSTTTTTVKAQQTSWTRTTTTRIPWATPKPTRIPRATPKPTRIPRATLTTTKIPRATTRIPRATPTTTRIPRATTKILRATTKIPRATMKIPRATPATFSFIQEDRDFELLPDFSNLKPTTKATKIPRPTLTPRATTRIPRATIRTPRATSTTFPFIEEDRDFELLPDFSNLKPTTKALRNTTLKPEIAKTTEMTFTPTAENGTRMIPFSNCPFLKTISHFNKLFIKVTNTSETNSDTFSILDQVSLKGVPLIVTFAFLLLALGFIAFFVCYKLQRFCIPLTKPSKKTPKSKKNSPIYRTNDIEMDSLSNFTHDDALLTEIDAILPRRKTLHSRMSSQSMLNLTAQKGHSQNRTFTTFRPISMASLSESEDFNGSIFTRSTAF